MRIGELARRAGVSTSTIRFYEARGLLPPAPRLANGYRDYDDRALAVVQFVDRAQGLGFTLREVAAHLRAPEDDGRKARLQARLEAKLAELDAHLEAVRLRRAVISGLIGEVRDARGAQQGQGSALDGSPSRERDGTPGSDATPLPSVDG